jgi:small subunit ribosomal protein S21
VYVSLEEVSLSVMAKILVHANENVKDALRRFKKLCDREGIVNRSKRVKRFEKPSERRRRKRNERLKNIRKAQKNKR